MSNSTSNYINTEVFKDFVNGSFVYQDDSLVQLAVEDVVKSGLSPEILSKGGFTNKLNSHYTQTRVSCGMGVHNQKIPCGLAAGSIHYDIFEPP